MLATLCNLAHTLYHYEVIENLSSPSTTPCLEEIDCKHKKRLSNIREHHFCISSEFSKNLQSELQLIVDRLADTTEVEKNAVREYIDYLKDAPL